MLAELAQMAVKLASRVTERALAEDLGGKAAAGDSPSDFAADHLAKRARAVRPADVFKIRAPWSPFNQVSRKPVLR